MYNYTNYKFPSSFNGSAKIAEAAITLHILSIPGDFLSASNGNGREKKKHWVSLKILKFSNFVPLSASGMILFAFSAKMLISVIILKVAVA